MATKEDFKITNEEADKLKKALKDEEFRKLLAEYAQEISDPENKRKYEEELTKLEKQRGVDVKFVHPNPGFVLKTFILPEGKTKAFINICQSDAIDKASSTRVKGDKREKWSIPLSLAPPRDDLDKSGNKCSVFDAVFHPDTYQKGQQNPRFKQMLIDTVFDTIENQLKTKLDRKNIIFLRMPYKGMPTATVMRQKSKTPEGDSSGPDLGLPFKVPYPPLKEESDAKPPKKHGKKKHKQKREKQPCEPEYSVVHRGGFSMQDFTNERESTRIKRPEQLVISVNLPGVETASGVDLDIYEKRLVLECAKPPYKLDLALPYPIDEDNGSAKFNKSKQVLVITLPVLPTQALDLPTAKTPLISEVSPPSSTNENQQSTTSHDEQEVRKIAKPELHVDSTDFDDDCLLDESVVGQLVHTTTASTSVTKEWTAKGDWKCPPFSYRQDETNVCFVLHTPEVKKSSLVTFFDEQYAQLTYKTENGQNYSFYIGFSDGCLLDADDCSADVSPDNIVLLMKKSAPESTSSKTTWEKFTAGLNVGQTTEKLFLTAANVQSAVEQLDSLSDPWMQNNTWSKSAEVKVKSVSEEKLVVEITDPASRKPDTGVSSDSVDTATISDVCSSEKVVDTTANTSDVLSKDTEAVHSQQNSEAGPSTTTSESLVTTVGKEHDNTKQHSASTDSSTGEVDNLSTSYKQTESNGLSRSATVSRNVMVEEDGSVFIKADDEYLKRRYDAYKSNQDSTATATQVTKGGIQLSNQLIYSLDD